MSGERCKIQLRGIYATALTQLLHHNFSIVQPSIDIQERLDLEYTEVDPDVSIEDRRNRHGVILRGDNECLKRVRGTIAENLEESIFFSKVRGVIEVDFPLSMKRRLDDLRREVVLTLTDHHYYKSFGREVRAVLDMAERLLKKGRPREMVEEKFQRTIAQYNPYEGSTIKIDHLKLNGFNVDLGKADILSFKDDLFVYEREIRSDGTYDGLNVKKESGDKAVSRVSLPEYYIETKYYSINGKLRGTYLNINTPVEIYSSKIRYIDLDIDVIIWPDGRREIIDEKDLERAESLGVITEELADKARGVAEKLFNNYD
jgi:protein associated with RNAse G/E